MRGLRGLGFVVWMVTMQASVAEFVAIQRMTDAERRERFRLSCDPVVSAVRLSRERLDVTVQCPPSADSAGGPPPPDRGRPG